MKSITIEPRLAADPELHSLIESANRVLDHEIGPSSGQVEAAWSYAADSESPSNGPLIGLSIKDFTGSASTVISRNELSDPRRIAVRVVRLWGDLLQVRSHKQLASLAESTPQVEGGEVLDLISDAICRYTEPEGAQPKILKLPVRYAIALVKLGHAFWGDVFQQIRESGIRAIEGKPLFGVPVKLVYGVDAKLDVE
jgi:hypothetical protein